MSFENFQPSVFHEMSVSRSRLDFFPNLRSFVCHPDPIVLHLFTHPSVTSLTFYGVDAFRDVERGSVFAHIHRYMPTLQTLEIHAYTSDDLFEILEPAMAKMFSQLTSLRKLCLPACWVSPLITQTVSSLGNLEALEALDDYPEDTELLPNTFSHRLPSDSFPALAKLTLEIPFWRAVECFSGSYRPSGLVSLYLSTFSGEAESSLYQRMIEIISSHCPNLERLGLHIYLIEDFGRAHYGDQLFHGNLRPLSACQRLSTLRFSHPLPFMLYPHDIILLVKSLPLLRTLDLNSWPGHSTLPSVLHISCLSTIAPFCDSLTELGLYVDTSTPDLPDHDEGVSFKSLKLLRLRSSPPRLHLVGENDPIRDYLRHVLPRKCAVEGLARARLRLRG